MGEREINESGDADMTSFSKLFLVLFVLLVLPAPIFVSVGLAEINKNAAASTIEGAEASVASAHEAVLEAEQNGADVSDLVVVLNDAAELLAEANIAYGLGQFDEAAGFAGLCLEASEAVRSDAVALRVETQGARVWELWLNLIGSLVGVVVVVFGGLVGWGYVKKRYFKRALGMKPEVPEG